MKRFFYIFLLIFLVLSLACSRDLDGKEITKENLPRKDKKEQEIEKTDPIDLEIREMNLKEKIGQLFIFGFKDKAIDNHIKNLIEEYKISGLIFFDRNIGSKEEIKSLIQDLKSINDKNKIPLFLSTDEEGGRVSRLNNIFKNIPSAEKISKEDDLNQTFKYGKEIGKRFSHIGFNLDYAPVLDINTNPNNPVIGDRAFGNTSNSVVEHGISFMKGLREEEIISCVKHFPGHGDTDIDSHIGLPLVNKTLEELNSLELVPFKKAIGEDVDMIMVSHILYPKIDEKYPASMSNKIINDILREDLQFTGVVITDDLTMGGIKENYKIEDAVLEFFKAGGDLALIAHDEEIHTEIIETVMKSLELGDLSIDEIDEKLYRILKLKKKYFYK